MRLMEMTKRAVEILQRAGEHGCLNMELAYKLGVSRRRIYDIIAVLRAVDLIKTIKERRGTRIIWKTPLHFQEEKERLLQEYRKLKKEKNSLEKQLSILEEQLEALREKKIIQTSETVKFNVRKIRIKSELGFLKISGRGMEAVVESSRPGIIIQPLPIYVPVNPTKIMKTDEER